MAAATTTALWMTLAVVVGMATAHPAESRPDAQLDEFVVSGKRLDVLRKELLKSEDEFFDRYNILIGRKEYQVHCRNEQPLGSRIPRRYCRTGFEDDALAQAGSEAGIMLQRFYNDLRMSGGSGGDFSPKVPLTTTSVTPSVVESKRGEFRRQMREVVVKDMELLKILVRHAQLLDEYRKVEGELFGSGGRNR